MTDQPLDRDVTSEEVDTNSRDYWKEQADKLALSYPSNIPTEKLITLVKTTIQTRAEAQKNNATNGLNKSVGKLALEVQSMQDTAMSLVRFKLTVLDPNKRSLTGMFVSAGNDNIAPVKRMIPFNVPVWHAERIIVEHLKNVKYTALQSKYNPNLRSSFDDPSSRKLMPSFLIEELPPLTPEELADLQKLQAQQGTGQTASEG